MRSLAHTVPHAQEIYRKYPTRKEKKVPQTQESPQTDRTDNDITCTQM